MGGYVADSLGFSDSNSLCTRQKKAQLLVKTHFGGNSTMSAAYAAHLEELVRTSSFQKVVREVKFTDEEMQKAFGFH